MASIKVKFRPSTASGREGSIYYQVIHGRIVRQVKTYPQGGGIVLITFPVGGKVAAHFLDEPFQPVGVLCLQLVVFGLRQKNILVSAIGRGRLPTHSHCLALCKVVYSSLVRGRFSDHHKVGFLTISRTVFRLYEGRISGHQLVGKLYLWHTRHFHI